MTMTVIRDPKNNPPSIHDPPTGSFIPTDIEGIEVSEDNVNLPEYGQGASYIQDSYIENTDWLQRARDAYRFSTTFVESNYSLNWAESIEAFNSRHVASSKYKKQDFDKRSQIFRPKTRTIIRKNEAAAASAFFSNMDRISISAVDDSDIRNRITAEVMQNIIQYRLVNTIPWFMIVMGGLQDAQVQGASICHIYWDYRDNGYIDGPRIDIIPIENFRIDPSSDWMDPVNDSPYLIHLIPMHVGELRERMMIPDRNGSYWKYVSESDISQYLSGEDNAIRSSRQSGSQDPSQENRFISDYDIIWVHRHIHKLDGEDWEFYTIKSEVMLTDPRLLSDSVAHGKRPYVIGKVIIETHKTFPSSIPMLVKGLQEESNELANQRLDNLKFVMNKRWFARRGADVDIYSLIRNVPGGVTLVDDPERDIKEVSWPDITKSAYQEQDRIDADFSDLIGNFDPMQIQATRTGRESANTIRMLQGPSNLLTEYMLKTYVETFIQPILKQLVELEKCYETDEKILKISKNKSKLIKRIMMQSGIQGISNNDILSGDIEVNINVGMGATDPTARLQKLVFAAQSMAALTKLPPVGISLSELFKEIMSLSGYREVDRFMTGQDPDKLRAQQQIQQLTMMVRQLQSKVREKEQTLPTKKAIAHESNMTKVLTKAMDHKHDLAMAAAGAAAESISQTRQSTLESISRDRLENSKMFGQERQMLLQNILLGNNRQEEVQK